MQENSLGGIKMKGIRVNWYYAKCGKRTMHELRRKVEGNVSAKDLICLICENRQALEKQHSQMKKIV
jgi:hypothetical protein